MLQVLTLRWPSGSWSGCVANQTRAGPGYAVRTVRTRCVKTVLSTTYRLSGGGVRDPANPRDSNRGDTCSGASPVWYTGAERTDE